MPNAKRILVVDDNTDAALMLAEVLEAMGHDARCAHDGHAALDAAASFHPHIALLDIGLPGMDGLELARQLRARTDLADIRLIAISGYGQDSDRRRSVEAGFAVHLVKPVDLATLGAAIDGAVAQSDGPSISR